MRKGIFIMAMVMAVTLMLAGCSSVPKEEEIQQDLESFLDKAFLDEGEKIDSLTIEKRNTDKKNTVSYTHLDVYKRQHCHCPCTPKI